MNYVKGVAALAVLSVLIWAGSVVIGWRNDAALLPGAQAEAERVRSSFNEYRRNTAAEVARLSSVAQGFQNELSTLHADRARPVTLRVCGPATPPRPAAEHPAAAAVADGAAAGVGRVPEVPAGDRAPGGTGIDAGPVLDLAARDADTVTAIARGLQAYVRGLPPQCLIAPTS